MDFTWKNDNFPKHFKYRNVPSSRLVRPTHLPISLADYMPPEFQQRCDFIELLHISVYIVLLHEKIEF